MDFDIFLLYRQFSEIKSGKSYPCREGVNVLIDETEKAKFSREAMAQFSKMMDSTINMRIPVLDELQKLMSSLNTTVNFSEFSQFYDFAFLVCRENGQKSITVNRAVAAWKLVLAGRFRLLNQWCDFVEKTQRHNISEDTWCQVLAFSHCVQEDLEGFDSRGAWPTLIDDFVEHMYRITGSSDRSSHNLTCTSGKPEGELSPSADHLPGLMNFPGSKRKHHGDSQRSGLEHNSLPRDMVNSINWLKRRK